MSADRGKRRPWDVELTAFQKLVREAEALGLSRPERVEFYRERSAEFDHAWGQAGDGRRSQLNAETEWHWLDVLNGTLGLISSLHPPGPAPRPGTEVDEVARRNLKDLSQLVTKDEPEFARAWIAASWTTRWDLVHTALPDIDTTSIRSAMERWKKTRAYRRNQWLNELIDHAVDPAKEDRLGTLARHFVDQYGPLDSGSGTAPDWDRFERTDGWAGFDRMIPTSWIAKPREDISCGHKRRGHPPCGQRVARIYDLDPQATPVGIRYAMVARCRLANEVRGHTIWVSVTPRRIRLLHGSIWQITTGTAARAQGTLSATCGRHSTNLNLDWLVSMALDERAPTEPAD